jgi:dipeptidyl aminopeptidase/acylaminoacyl peptidase
MSKLRITLFAILSLILSFATLAQTKRPITHEDVWLMKRVGAPAPSPDGRWVVFPVVEPAYDEKDQVSDLWIVPADGSSRPRRLTFTKGGESGANWSADSRMIAFSAKRENDEVNQIYVIDVVTGGEAIRVTSVSTGARSPQFSPDGKTILFQSSVYPGAMNDEDNKRIAAERRARKYRARVYDAFPIRNWDRWLEDTQTHLFVQSLEHGSKAKDLLAGTKLTGAAGFAGATTAGGDDLQPVWTPDGASIVFVATTNRHTAAYSETNTDLFQVSISGGEPKQLTTGKDSYARPAFSPDGKALYCIVNPSTDKVYNLDRIARFAWPQMGERMVVAAKFDRSVSSFAISPDGKLIFMTAEDAGHEKIYSLPASGGEPKLALEMTSGVYTSLAIPGRASSLTLFANWESATNPAEVVRLDPGAKTPQVLTDFNAQRAARIDWQSLRHFTFTSRRGKQIHSMIALPPAFDENKKYPLFVVIHGGPHSMWRDQFFLRWNYHLLAAPGYVALLTNYTGSTGFGEKFAQEIQLDPLRGPGEEINEAADEAIRRFKFIDASRQAAGGASYGGHMANWLQATTTRYKCLISHAGLVNLESQWGTSDIIYSRELNNGGPVWEQGPVWREQNPIRYAAKFRTPILITIGENDFRVPLNNSLENWSVLQRLKIPSKLIVFPEENHWILKGENSRFWYGEVHAWLKRWLNGEGQGN